MGPALLSVIGGGLECGFDRVDAVIGVGGVTVVFLAGIEFGL